MQFPSTLEEAKAMADRTGRPVFQRQNHGVYVIPMDGEEQQRLESYPNYEKIYERPKSRV